MSTPHRKWCIEQLEAGKRYQPPRLSWQAAGRINGKQVRSDTAEWLKDNGHLVMVVGSGPHYGVHPSRAKQALSEGQKIGRRGIKTMRSLGYQVSDEGIPE